jgi:PBS lyase HEAT-like repeat
MMRRPVALFLAMCSGALPLPAQSLGDRVHAVRDGMAEVRFAARRGSCGDGSYTLSFGGRSRMGTLYGPGVHEDQPCRPGPVRVRLRVEGGEVRDVRSYVGPLVAIPSELPVTDLGTVPAAEASRYFLSLARSGEGRTSTRAVLPAVLADSVSVWRDLARLARDTGRPRATRTDAAFWLGRFASARLEGRGENLEEPDNEPERDGTREAAVFALSQLRNGEGVPALIDVVRGNRDAHVRRQALFWLAQSGDVRGIDVMEEILRS